MSVVVEHDLGRDLILVRDSKNPKSAPLEWSRDMWESSVWARIVEGQLPAMAREFGVDPDPMTAATWGGGDVLWGRHQFTADEWRAFVQAVEAGEMSVEAIVGG
jgi:hypothetical protein